MKFISEFNEKPKDLAPSPYNAPTTQAPPVSAQIQSNQNFVIQNLDNKFIPPTNQQPVNTQPAPWQNPQPVPWQNPQSLPKNNGGYVAPKTETSFFDMLRNLKKVGV